MSEIYRQIRAGTAPPLPADGKCDAWNNPEVDDCRGKMCDQCAREIRMDAAKSMRDIDLNDLKTESFEAVVTFHPALSIRDALDYIGERVKLGEGVSLTLFYRNSSTEVPMKSGIDLKKESI